MKSIITFVIAAACVTSVGCSSSNGGSASAPAEAPGNSPAFPACATDLTAQFPAPGSGQSMASLPNGTYSYAGADLYAEAGAARIFVRDSNPSVSLAAATIVCGTKLNIVPNISPSGSLPKVAQASTSFTSSVGRQVVLTVQNGQASAIFRDISELFSMTRDQVNTIEATQENSGGQIDVYALSPTQYKIVVRKSLGIAKTYFSVVYNYQP